MCSRPQSCKLGLVEIQLSKSLQVWPHALNPLPRGRAAFYSSDLAWVLPHLTDSWIMIVIGFFNSPS